jgi:pimeloyl-ACP methyl ester carboxylesterase
MSDFGPIQNRRDLVLAMAAAGIPDRAFSLAVDRYADCDGSLLHYLDWEGGGLPIVFIHGGGLTAHTFDLVCMQLQDRYRSLALDLRGHGDSDWATDQDYSIDSYVRDVRAFIGELGLDQTVLVGMSLGGQTALSLAAQVGERVRALVLIDVGPQLRPQGVKRVHDFMKMEWRPAHLEEFVERAIEFNPRRDPALLRRSLLHNLRRLDDDNWTWKYDPAASNQQLSNLQREELTDRLWRDVHAVDCAVLVVRGQDSDVLSAADATNLAQRFKHGRLVTIPKAGHTVQGDNPRDLATALRGFLDEVVQ